MDKQRIALTWGDAGENHVGMEIIGNLQETGTGFKFDDLQAIDEYNLNRYWKKEVYSLFDTQPDLRLSLPSCSFSTTTLLFGCRWSLF